MEKTGIVLAVILLCGFMAGEATAARSGEPGVPG
jgi:hypothetical protein